MTYKDGILAGEAVLEVTKPGDHRMLPHCLENGVRIVADRKRVEHRHSAIRISKGVGIEEIVSTAATEYAIDNHKDEEFRVVIEHRNLLEGNSWGIQFSGTVGVEAMDKIPDGRMLALTVAPQESVILLVTESVTEIEQTKLRGFDWLKTVIVRRDNPLAKDERIKACADIQEKIDNIDTELAELAGEVQGLQSQMVRTRENLRATGDKAQGSIVSEWINDLNTTENGVRVIEKTKIPALKADRKNLEDALRAALKKLNVEWEDKPKAE